jgi:Tol biopolymer transport system component
MLSRISGGGMNRSIRSAVVSALAFALAVLVPTAARAVTATTRRADVSSAGDEAPNGAIYESISGNGRFVAFETNSPLVNGDTNGLSDVYVRDLRDRSTVRVSVRSNGRQANGASGYAAISANGRFVTFMSEATNLIRDDTNGRQDVFVHDRRTGETTRVSVSTRGRQGNGDSSEASISASGRFVLFGSDATNLVRGDTNGYNDLFLHDRGTGTTVRIDVASSERQANASPNNAAPGMISNDGRFVVFESSATNLVRGDTNAAADVFVRDVERGRTIRVSVSSQGSQGDALSRIPSISADGRFVSFTSSATNLVRNDGNAATDIFVRDLSRDRTTRASIRSDGAEANGGSGYASISADGRFVSFESAATNLVGNDTNGYGDVFVHDRQTGRTRRVSLGRGGQEGDSESDVAYISPDGRFVAFQSAASNLVGNDTNATVDIFVRGPLR